MKKFTRNQRPQFMAKDQLMPTKPLPPDPEMLNANRARWATAALDEFRRQTGADMEDAVSDLLADFMHWCDRFGQEFHEELRRALNHYAEETSTSSEATAPSSDEL